jgi:AraC family transcriptional regulator, regulatory protein of adaptative response / methylated-DNA-[protein]-cysteine methyltransferase
MDHLEVIEKAMQVIDANVDATLPLDALSQELHISPSHLHRLFKSATGLTPRQYAAGQRLEKFKAQVRGGQPVTQAMYEAGYSSSSRLYEGASERMGMTPAAYRRGGQGMDVHYTIVDTYLGRMLVAATTQGICAVSFGDEDGNLETFLRSEYPAASLSRDDTSFKVWVDELLKNLEGAQPRLVLPLDLQATAFQLRVWEELRKIPYGETRSYSEVARAMGEPKAARAVANACANNPAAIVTPCHRVVRSDGQPGGYRWGMPRKQALLARERSKSSERTPGSKEQA